MKSENYSRNEQTQETELDVVKAFQNILSKLWLVILVGLITALGAYYYTSEMITPTYSSTARVYIQNRQTNQSSSSDLQSATTLKEDFQVIVTSDEVYRQALESLNEDGKNYKILRGKVSLDNNTTRFVDITVSDPDPVRAKQLVDAIAYVSRIRAKEILGVEDVAIEQLGSVSTTPSSPNMSRNIVLGAAAGMAVVCIIITLISLFNNKITTADDIEKYLGITVLGSIPDIKSIPGYAKKVQTVYDDESESKDEKEKKPKLFRKADRKIDVDSVSEGGDETENGSTEDTNNGEVTQ